MPKTYINLQDDSLLNTKLIPSYEKWSEDIKKELTELHETITSVCMDSQVESLVDSLNNYINKINTELKDSALKAFDTWTDSETSISAYAGALGSGEEATVTARNIEESLRANLEGIFIPELSLINVDKSKPKLEEKHYTELEEAFDKALNSLNTLQEDIHKEIDNLSEEDCTEHCVKVASTILIDYVINALKSSTSSIKDAQERTDTITEKKISDVKDAVTQVKQEATSAEAISRLFNNMESWDND